MLLRARFASCYKMRAGAAARSASCVAAASTTGRTDRHVVHAREPARRAGAIAVRESRWRIGGRLRHSKSESISTQEVGYYEYSRGPMQVRAVRGTSRVVHGVFERASLADAGRLNPCLREKWGEGVEIDVYTTAASTRRHGLRCGRGRRRGTIFFLSTHMQGRCGSRPAVSAR